MREQEAREEGIAQEKRVIATRMLKEGLEIALIAKFTKLPKIKFRN